MTLNFRDCELDGVPGSIPQRIFCALHYGAVLNIKDSRVDLLDEFKHHTPMKLMNSRKEYFLI